MLNGYSNVATLGLFVATTGGELHLFEGYQVRKDEGREGAKERRKGERERGREGGREGGVREEGREGGGKEGGSEGSEVENCTSLKDTS